MTTHSIFAIFRQQFVIDVRSYGLQVGLLGTHLEDGLKNKQAYSYVYTLSHI